jgi:hypothetical protein
MFTKPAIWSYHEPYNSIQTSRPSSIKIYFNFTIENVIEDKKLLGRPRYRWEDIIKVNLKEMGRDGVGWIQMAQETFIYWLSRDLLDP